MRIHLFSKIKNIDFSQRRKGSVNRLLLYSYKV